MSSGGVSEVEFLLAAVALATSYASGMYLLSRVGEEWGRSRRNAAARYEQTIETLKVEYQDRHQNPHHYYAPAGGYATLPPAPLSALSTCPSKKCRYFGWHEMRLPDPSRRATTVENWTWTEDFEVHFWGQEISKHVPGRYVIDRRREGLDEHLLEVVRTCPECGVEWGVTTSGKVVTGAASWE